ncbi:MAG TPA: hypothetical protein [Caudoviricetes sp.]|nr:MAG TPA: hypothetical protein [Caudoviricetes sp.]
MKASSPFCIASSSVKLASSVSYIVEQFIGLSLVFLCHCSSSFPLA